MSLHFIQPSQRRRRIPAGVLEKLRGGTMRECADEVGSVLQEMSARQVLKKLGKEGCEVVRQKGSHVQVKCPGGKQSTVPQHGSRDIKKGTLHAIEKSLGIDIDGDGRPPKTEDLIDEGRKKKVSVDAIIQFKHEGKKVTAKMVSSVWKGGNDMEYTWLTSDGETIHTRGVPKPFKVISDVAPRHRR